MGIAASLIESGIARGGRDVLGAVIGAAGEAVRAISPGLHHRYARMLMRGPLSGSRGREVMAIVARLDDGMPPLDVVEAVAAALKQALSDDALAKWLDRPKSRTEATKRTLIRCDNYLPGRRWKLQIFYIPHGQSHPPHSHDDMASCLIVARGRIEAREYNRLRRLENGGETLMLEQVSDRVLGPGEAMLTNDDHHNVHWFGAAGGDAVALNFQVVGFGRGKKPSEKLRSYVDPTAGIGNGPFAATRLGKVEAHERFAGVRVGTV